MAVPSEKIGAIAQQRIAKRPVVGGLSPPYQNNPQQLFSNPLEESQLMATKYVYFFGPNGTEGDATMKNTLGGKGANLAEMAKLGLPVPAGFTITTEFCTVFFAEGRQFPQSLRDEVATALKKTEEAMGMKYGDPENPLLAVLPQRRPHVDARHDGNRARTSASARRRSRA